MKFPSFCMKHEPQKCYNTKGESDSDVLQQSSEALIVIEDKENEREHANPPINYTDEDLRSQIKSAKTGNIILSFLNIAILCSFIVFNVGKFAFNKRKEADHLHMSRNDRDFQESLMSKESRDIVTDQVFCISCEAVRGTEYVYFDAIDAKKCCIKDILNLIRLMRLTNLQTLNEYSTQLNVLKSNIDEVREDTKALTNGIFASNRTNSTDTDTSSGSIPKESVMWTLIMKNNKLLNLMLNRNRSVLYLIGTAVDGGMYWSIQVATGDLSYKGNKIHIESGGHYMMECNIHFSKNVCNGTERIGYFINQEYRPNEMLHLARAQADCVTGSSIDENLQLKTVLRVGLWQRMVLKLEYDKSLQSMISNYHHYVIIYEI